jgi:serine/threonine protein kinase
VECKNIFRELSLLRQFSEMKGNIFVTKLLDVKLATDGKDGIENATGMFFIMEHVPNDLKQMMKMVDNNCFEEEHVKIIFYNLLCALNFVHTANVMHRDIKPANLLIDSSCQVKLCDFGQARTVPKFSERTVSSQSAGILSNQSTDASPIELHTNTTGGNKKKMKPIRKLSNHICSRWYRPPEIVLTQKEYN